MRFAIIASDLGYLVRFRSNLLAHIQGLGHEVIALCPDGQASDREALERLGVRMRPVSMARSSISPVSDAATRLALRRELGATRPDMVLAYTMKPIVFGLPAAARRGVTRRSALITGLGRMFMGHGPAGVLRREAACTLYRRALRGADAVMFQNAEDAALFASRKVLDPVTRVTVVRGSGVDLDEYPALPLPALPHFLMTARIMREKGILEFIQACRFVRRERPHVRCTLAGYFDGSPDPELAREVARAQHDGVIRFAGRVADVRPLLRECSVFVLPSHREGLSRAILEAVASGRAVITTDAPGCRDAVRTGPGGTGLTVPVGSGTALAEAMLAMVDRPSEVASMAVRARCLAEREFDVRSVNSAMAVALGLDVGRGMP